MSVIIGISGGSASGKTSFTAELQDRFGDKISVIGQDSYYKPLPHLSAEEKQNYNFDSPDAFDRELLIKHLLMLKKGEAVDSPVYDYSVHDRKSESVHITPAPVIILDGILIFDDEDILRLLDYKFFVDVPADERILRRLNRDVLERGRTVDSVIKQYRSTVRPMHDEFVEPSKLKADMIIPYSSRNTKAPEILAHFINNLIKGETI